MQIQNRRKAQLLAEERELCNVGNSLLIQSYSADITFQQIWSDFIDFSLVRLVFPYSDTANKSPFLHKTLNCVMIQGGFYDCADLLWFVYSRIFPCFRDEVQWFPFSHLPTYRTHSFVSLDSRRLYAAAERLMEQFQSMSLPQLLNPASFSLASLVIPNQGLQVF